MNWPIFVPSNPAPAGTSASAKPIHKQLNAIGRGTIYQVPATSSLAALLAALAAAGEPAPSAAAPVWAVLEGTGRLMQHRGSGWSQVAPMPLSRNALTVDSGAVGGTELAVLSTSLPHGEAMTARVTVSGEIQSTATGGRVLLRVRAGSTSGAQIGRTIRFIPSAIGLSGAETLTAVMTGAVPAAASSIVVTLHRDQGAPGTVLAMAGFEIIVDQVA